MRSARVRRLVVLDFRVCLAWGLGIRDNGYGLSFGLRGRLRVRGFDVRIRARLSIDSLSSTGSQLPSVSPSEPLRMAMRASASVGIVYRLPQSRIRNRGNAGRDRG